MRVERFKAANTREAMTAVKKKLGAEAVVLHSRATLDGVEIIAAVDSSDQKEIAWPAVPAFPQKRSMSANISRTDMEKLTANIATGQDEAEALQPMSRRPEQTKPAVNAVALPSRNGNGNNGKIGDLSTPAELALQRNGGLGGAPEISARLEKDSAQKAADFAQALKEEISTIEESRQIWLQSEKRLDSLKRELADLKETLLRQELADLQDRAEKLRQERAARKAELITAPEDSKRRDYFKKILLRLQERGVSKELSETIVVELKNQTQELELDKEADMRRLQERFAQVLMEMIPVQKNDKPPSFSTKVIALIGPAGAGKTSACVKLAVSSALIQNKRVALVLVSKAGSATAKHLGLLANVAQLPLTVVQTHAQLKATVAAYNDKDLVLVDFAGEQETDGHRESSFSAFVSQMPATEVHLVMQATQSLQQCQTVLEQFAQEKYGYLVLTHLDEMQNIGMLLDLLQMVGKPLSYICNGTVIPDHIEPASATKLTKMILRG